MSAQSYAEAREGLAESLPGALFSALELVRWRDKTQPPVLWRQEERMQMAATVRGLMALQQALQRGAFAGRLAPEPQPVGPAQPAGPTSLCPGLPPPQRAPRP